MSVCNTRQLRVLVGCEFSGRIRDAFTARGHHAMSCDLLPSETPGYHHQGDISDVLNMGWDVGIFHPPRTHLAVSGARYFAEKRKDGRQQEGINFFMLCINAPIPHIAVENPVSIMSTVYRKPDQIVQPFWFGHPETKATCLWLKNLPPLKPTHMVTGRAHRIHNMPPGPNRWKERSRTYQGFADACAQQWSAALLNKENG